MWSSPTPPASARNDLAFWPGTLPAGQRLRGRSSLRQPVDGGTLIGGLDTRRPTACRRYSFAHGGRRSRSAPDAALRCSVAPDLLENAYVRVELDAAGDITRIYDKTAGREVLPAGAIANQFQAFEDRPLDWDAWDIDIFYDDKRFLAEPAESMRVVESGPLRATLEIKRRILQQPLHAAHLAAPTTARRSTSTPTSTGASGTSCSRSPSRSTCCRPAATYEIQWGSVQRPTHRNTSWDWARFETCAQKWVDLSEGGYGVALLNDCKYGHDIRDNVIRISLLRAPTRPDPEADQGEHRFAYSLYPHAGAAGSGATNYEIAQQRLRLQRPADRRHRQPAQPATAPPAPLVHAARQPDHRDDQAGRGRQRRDRALLRMQPPARPGHAAGGLPAQRSAHHQPAGRKPGALPIADQSVQLYVKPFQIVTVRLVPA